MYRNNNAFADELCNLAMDTKRDGFVQRDGSKTDSTSTTAPAELSSIPKPKAEGFKIVSSREKPRQLLIHELRDMGSRLRSIADSLEAADDQGENPSKSAKVST